MRFRNRAEAGRLLAARLKTFAGRPDLVVLALPRGGVPVAFEVARALHVPLDIFVVRKLGVPGHEELAMGAIATGGVSVMNDDVVRSLGIPQSVINAVAAEEERELHRREQLYREDASGLEVTGRTVILVDDGLATGSTMRAAIAALRQLKPARVIVAVPVGAPETCAEFRGIADDVVCPLTPAYFRAVGCWYEDFSQTSDEEVRWLLKQAEHQRQPAAH
jgi:putative phosphoribosyl transferase